MKSNTKKTLAILMITIGALLLVGGFTPYIQHGMDYKGENPYFGLGFIGITLMVLSSQVIASHDNQEDSVKLQELRDEYNISNIIVENGEIVSGEIIYGNREFTFVEEDGGYNLDTPIKIIKNHSKELKNQIVLIRHKRGDINTGTMYDFWGIYKSTGRKVVNG